MTTPEALTSAALAAANASTATPSVRQRILTTAHDLFYRDGVRATGIDRVIAESGVSKVTLYRQFPSKNELIQAYLDLRHERWMGWFRAALERHAATHPGARALVPALGEWLRSESFRGCAFLNTVGEMGATLPEVMTITRAHKQDMTQAIEALLPPSPQRSRLAGALALAVDGAIVQAQFAETPEAGGGPPGGRGGGGGPRARRP
ncbi:MAG: TetR/AcrR family transcriptional regulator, partial [Burkholderiaceae bacterium]